MRWFSALCVLCAALFGCDETLGPSHEGWRVADCWSCHNKGETHYAERDAHGCVECHGDNGALMGHYGPSPCADCHGQPHGAKGFPDPVSCRTCHRP
ncbi:hypothetical protein KKF91_08850 [Myxococcota bacterium]|nr:hypothetical protein [Myxococcota bacterium]MBU1430649.1 hypothetical protein [Myxococcota bacterium]MBU1899260.1 hypothetical protein [Myxococcota bacterium]